MTSGSLPCSAVWWRAALDSDTPGFKLLGCGLGAFLNLSESQFFNCKRESAVYFARLL